jgi:hypothetical protein
MGTPDNQPTNGGLSPTIPEGLFSMEPKNKAIDETSEKQNKITRIQKETDGLWSPNSNI